jgi:hypothetical protein
METAVILHPHDLTKFANDVAMLVLKEVAKMKAVEEPLTKEGAAKYLHVSVPTLERRLRENDLPPSLIHRNGGTPYFFASELEQHLKKSKS